jgi:dissimilatory sulfite reductase (desulfoviridin) alpha/beta subunit
MHISELNTVPCTVAPEDVARVKGLGCLRDKTTPDCFNCRVLTRNGKITSSESIAIAEAAAKFGKGEVAMTTRQTIEIQGVPYGNIDAMRAFLNQHGLDIGGTGPKVRPVVSCKGTTCVFGLIDTYSLSEKIHNLYYVGYHDVKLPHKFKIAVGGCPNNCVKPDLNDLGIVGQRIMKRDLDACRGCKKCQVESACPIKIAHVADGKLITEGCNNCGRCLGKCPFHVCDEFEVGYKVCIGGRWGKRVAQGRALDVILTDEEQVLSLVEKCILLFREQGVAGERFADTVARIGFDKAQEMLLSDEILERKEEILK